MRQNHLFDVPFTPLNAFMKLPRGTSEVLCQGEKLLVRWKDNNTVTVATNMDEKYTETSVKRWNRHRRGFDNVQQPKCISRYNEHMGGVDLHDQQVSQYNMSIRSKTWWQPIFAWSINSALVNGHLFYRDVIGGTIDLLTFSRIVSQSLLQRFGTKPLSHGRRSLLSATVEDQARYDKASNWPINTMHRFQRCRHCQKRTTYACEKCKVPLHIECFKLYHGVQKRKRERQQNAVGQSSQAHTHTHKHTAQVKQTYIQSVQWLIQHSIPLVTIVTDHKTHFFTHFSMKISKKKIMIDCFKGILMTHELDKFCVWEKFGIKWVHT